MTFWLLGTIKVPGPTSGIGLLSNVDNDAKEETTMPARNVNLTDELEQFITAKVASGRYENASEVVRASLRALEREEQQYEAKMERLLKAIDDGLASPRVPDGAFDRVRARAAAKYASKR